GLTPGAPLVGLPVNRVFIGSCTNARLSDLEAAAAVVRGRRVADGVVAMVVPGSSTVKREAEAKGLDRVFRDAGFAWGESGCSMCAGGNGDRGEPGERIVSTTNRNFENRQAPRARTRDDGCEEPGVVLNRPQLRKRGMRITGQNFGAGSSRESAVWGMLANTIRVIVARSFADIYRENCLQSGLLPVVLAPAVADAFEQRVIGVNGAEPFTVDLETQTISGPGGS